MNYERFSKVTVIVENFMNLLYVIKYLLDTHTILWYLSIVEKC